MSFDDRRARQPSWDRISLEPREASDKHNEIDEMPVVPFEIYSEAIGEAERNIKAPKELAACSALAIMSLSCQGLYDVRSPLGGAIPLSLSLMAIAVSGLGKTPMLRALSARIYEFQDCLLAERDLELSKFKSGHDIWLEILKAHKSKLKACVKSGKSVDVVVNAIEAHQRIEPRVPLKLKFLNEDVTIQALFGSMNEGLSSIGWISSEASGILESGAFQHFDKICSTWSGDGVRVGRVSADSYQIPDARLTTCLMVQPKIFDSFIKLKGEVAHGVGLTSRFLFCRPRTTQGARSWDDGVQSWDACNRFQLRAIELLSEYIELRRQGIGERREIILSSRAREIFINERNRIEKEISEEGAYGWSPGHASKLAENMIRIAAVFHVFEGRDGELSETTMRAAIELGYWFSRQYAKIFNPDTLLENDASVLHSWLRRQYEKTKSRRIDMVDVSRNCPNRLRSSERLRELYERLERDGIIRRVLEGKKNVIILN